MVKYAIELVLTSNAGHSQRNHHAPWRTGSGHNRLLLRTSFHGLDYSK
jgi:hypothetical protein